MADEREKLEENIRQLEQLKANGAMPAALADASIAMWQEKLVASANLEGDGAIAQGAGAVAVGKQGVYIGGSFQGNIYQGEDPAEDEKRLAVYHRWVMQSTSTLPLRGVDVGASDPTGEQKSIGLANIYVDLDTTTRTTKEHLGNLKNGQADLWLDGPNSTKVDFLAARDNADERFGQEISLPVLSAVVAAKRMVILGEPGGGKSTFVNFVAYCLSAHALEPEKNWLRHLNGWPGNSEKTLPVVVTLRDFARSFAEKLPARAEPQHLLEFIGARLKAQNLGFALPLLEKALEAGEAIVMLDGLDEVPTQSQRIFVRDAARAFMTRYEKSRFVITCRVLSYQPPAQGKPDLRLKELATFEIAPFDQEKIDRFVSAWYTELGQMGSVPEQDVSALTARLREAVRRPDLRRLSSNPLLLTVMSLVHTHRGRLPDARALLYEETVDILLWRWEQVKLGGQQDAPRLRQYLLEAGRTDVDLKRVLWQLAYEAHAASKPDASGESLADIPEHRILKALAALKCDEKNPDGDLNWARHMVDLMKVRAGLLLERQPEIFTFPHRTFQEYLAGAHLAAQSNFSLLVSELARRDMALWREAILYAVGKLVYVHGDVDKPLALAAELCPQDAQDGDTPWRLAWLAGDILQEIGLKRVRDSVLGRDQLKRSQERLKDLLEGGKLAPRERVRAGNTLSQLGDPRFDPEHWHLPTSTALSPLGFIHIPAGKFIMGSKDSRYDDEKPQHELNLPDYWLAKYPVTVAQYRAFVDASGYKIKDEASLRGMLNHPVVYVTWYDALEYCKWLGKQLKVVSGQWAVSGDPFWQGLASGSLTISLPSEAEWEKAARGPSTGSGNGRIYPWGNEPDPNKANYRDTGIGGTSPVGAFPGGQSPYGLLDMSGNVWEWTRSLFYYSYPYQPGDDREKIYDAAEYEKSQHKDKNGNNIAYVLRGGSFAHPDVDVRCAYRYRLDPDYRLRDNGFRVGLFFSRASR